MKLNNKIKIFIIILLNIIIQSTILSRLKIFGVIPNLSIPIIVNLSLGFGTFVGGYNALIIGLIEDAVFSSVIGVRALIYYLMGFLIGDSKIRINKEDYRTGVFLTAICTVINMVISYIIYLILGKNIELLTYLSGGVFIEILENIILYLILYRIFKKIFTFPDFRV